jgi:hypothetical protein
MLQDGGEYLKEAPGTIMDVKVLHVVANRQALPPYDIQLLHRVEGFSPIFWTDKLHDSSVS